MADLTQVPGTASLDEVVGIIEPDGGVIVRTSFLRRPSRR